MPAFVLSPRRDGAADPDWASSTYQGSCVVIAETEGLARRYAAGAFVRAMAAVADAARPPTGAAWLQDRLVAAHPAPPGATRTSLPAGGVIAPGHDCPTLRILAAPTTEAARDAEIAQAAGFAPLLEIARAAE